VPNATGVASLGICVIGPEQLIFKGKSRKKSMSASEIGFIEWTYLVEISQLANNSE